MEHMCDSFRLYVLSITKKNAYILQSFFLFLFLLGCLLYDFLILVAFEKSQYTTQDFTMAILVSYFML